MRIDKRSAREGTLYFAGGKFEWVIFRWSHLMIGIDVWENLTFHLCLGFFSFWLSFDNRRLPEFESKITFHNGYLWITPYGRMNEWRSDDHWYRRGITLPISDWIFGKARYTEKEIISEYEVFIPMPEGSYPATARLFKSNWTRRFNTQSIVRVEIKCEMGIPVEGKGENSWDCGMDGRYSITCPADNIEDGIGQWVGSILHDRKKYGGPFPEPVKILAGNI